MWVTNYINYIDSCVPHIYNDLQNMLLSYSFERPSCDYDYRVEKLYSYFYKDHPYGESVFEALVSSGFLPGFVVETDDKSIRLLVFEAYVHEYNVSHKKNFRLQP